MEKVDLLIHGHGDQFPIPCETNDCSVDFATSAGNALDGALQSPTRTNSNPSSPAAANQRPSRLKAHKPERADFELFCQGLVGRSPDPRAKLHRFATSAALGRKPFSGPRSSQ